MIGFNIQHNAKTDLYNAREKFTSISPRQLLISVFCGSPNERYISELIDALTEVFPETAILSTTTAGEIMDGGALEQQTVITFTQFQKTWVCSGLVEGNDDLCQTGLQLAAKTIHATRRWRSFSVVASRTAERSMANHSWPVFTTLPPGYDCKRLDG